MVCGCGGTQAKVTGRTVPHPKTNEPVIKYACDKCNKWWWVKRETYNSRGRD